MLRSATLRLIVVVEGSSAPANSTHGKIWAACLAVESAEMSLKNVRERMTQIARLGRLLSNSSDLNSGTLSRVITYLLSQHKVNFRPLYQETIKAFTEIGQSHGEMVWNTVWTEMEKVSKANNANLADLGRERPSWAAAQSKQSSRTDVVDEEEEPEYRCHNAERMASAVRDSWILSSSADRLDAIEIAVS